MSDACKPFPRPTRNTAFGFRSNWPPCPPQAVNARVITLRDDYGKIITVSTTGCNLRDQPRRDPQRDPSFALEYGLPVGEVEILQGLMITVCGPQPCSTKFKTSAMTVRIERSPGSYLNASCVRIVNRIGA